MLKQSETQRIEQRKILQSLKYDEVRIWIKSVAFLILGTDGEPVGVMHTRWRIDQEGQTVFRLGSFTTTGK